MFSILWNFPLPNRDGFSLRVYRSITFQKTVQFFKFRYPEDGFYVEDRLFRYGVQVLDEMGVGIYTRMRSRKNTDAFVRMVEVTQYLFFFQIQLIPAFFQ